jgi:methanethiol S-methyltransferase
VTLSEVLSLRPGVSMGRADGKLFLLAPPDFELLGPATPEVEILLRQLASSPVLRTDLDAHGKLLRELQSRGWLTTTVVSNGGPVYTVLPHRCPSHSPRPVPPELVLSRFACVRRDGGGLVVESPTAWCRMRLHHAEALLILGNLAGGADAGHLTPEVATMTRVVYLIYGIVAYLLFFAAILYGIGFVGDLDAVWKGINDGPPTTVTTALVINISLLLLFAVQHNVMARPWFKDWWTRFVPRPIERSTYVAASSLILMLLYWQWRPIPELIWSVNNPAAVMVMHAIFWIGWAVLLISTFLINHFELFGLHQVANNLAGRPMPPVRFKTPVLYKVVRHPIYLGFIIAFSNVGNFGILVRQRAQLLPFVFVLLALPVARTVRHRGPRSGAPLLVPTTLEAQQATEVETPSGARPAATPDFPPS